MNQSLTPIKSTIPPPTPSECGSEDEFKPNDKHFGRNNRLSSPQAGTFTQRKSPRLSPVSKKKGKHIPGKASGKSSGNQPIRKKTASPSNFSFDEEEEDVPTPKRIGRPRKTTPVKINTENMVSPNA